MQKVPSPEARPDPYAGNGRDEPRPEPPPGNQRASWRERLGGAEVILALALLLCYGFFRQHPLWNEYSRYDLVQAIVETSSTVIDPWHLNTGDKAFYQGHYYSDKAPGTALLGVPVQMVLNLAQHATGAPPPEPEASMQALAFAISAVPTVIVVLLLGRFLGLVVGRRWALVTSLGYGLGSMAFPFATMFFGHAASTAGLFGAFFLLWRWRADPQPWRLIAAGTLAGLAVITEIPVVLGVAILGVYAVWMARARAALFVLGGTPMLMILLGYNALAFGNPLSLGYQYATVFAEQNSQGILSIVWPSPATTAALLLGPRGLLLYAPWLALAPLGLVALRARLRAEVVVCGAIVAAFLAYNSGALNPLGGWTPGPRYLVPALPFAAILVALAPRVIRPLTMLLVGVSVAIFGVATATMPNAPESVRDPLRDLWLPRLASRDLAETIAWIRWGLHGLEPLAILAAGIGLAAAGLIAADRSDERTHGFRSAVVAGLLALVIGLASPLPPATPLDFGGRTSGGAERVEVVDAGVTALPTAAGSAGEGSVSHRARLWAQLENAGTALPDSRVTFTLSLPDGTEVWSGWHDAVAWRAGARERFAVEWQADLAAPVDYVVGVKITSPDGAIIYGRDPDAATLRR